MESDILIQREIFTARTTIGDVFLGGKNFCYSLEDTVRAKGIKVPGETAIPAGIYKWHITYSSRFKRDMISIYTESNGYQLIAEGISFKGLRIHGGNDHEDTEGCPLFAFIKVSDVKIYKTAEKDLLKWARSVGGKGSITIKN